MKLNVKAIAVAFALIWGGGLFFFTLWVMLFEGATHEPTFIALCYRGYNISWPGAFIGLAWGVADGFVGGAVFGWLYNLLAHRFTRAA